MCVSDLTQSGEISKSFKGLGQVFKSYKQVSSTSHSRRSGYKPTP